MKLHEVCKDQLDAPTPTLDDLVKKHGVDEKTLKIQLDKGVKEEMEHTTDKAVAKEIALDHIAEDPSYYDKLEKIEK